MIAQRWVGRLKQSDRTGRLQAVMCANDGYLPGRVNFSVRRATRDVDLIRLLKEAADSSGEDDIWRLLGEDYASGRTMPGGGLGGQAGLHYCYCWPGVYGARQAAC